MARYVYTRIPRLRGRRKWIAYQVTSVTATMGSAIGVGVAGTVIPEVDQTLGSAVGVGVANDLIWTVGGTVSGVAGTGAVGSLTPSVGGTVTGVFGTGIAGAITPQVGATITGVFGTGAAGVITATSPGQIAGVFGAGVVGGVKAQVSGFFTGVFGTGVAGTLTPFNGIVGMRFNNQSRFNRARISLAGGFGPRKTGLEPVKRKPGPQFEFPPPPPDPPYLLPGPWLSELLGRGQPMQTMPDLDLSRFNHPDPVGLQRQLADATDEHDLQTVLSLL